MLEPDLIPFITAMKPVSDRILVVTLDSRGNPIPVAVVVAYAPHNGYSQQDKKISRQQLNAEYKNIPRKRETFLLTDAKGQVGKASPPR